MENQQPKKRAKKATNNPDENAPRPNARGRPRLNIGPESSKERRRAQIREAQRAYRGRKEDTIATLNRRVESLQGVISEMTNTLAAFESATAGLPPELREQMRQTTERMAAIAAKSAEGAELVASPESTESRSTGAVESPASAGATSFTPENTTNRFHGPSGGMIPPEHMHSGQAINLGGKRGHSDVDGADDGNQMSQTASQPPPPSQSSMSTPQNNFAISGHEMNLQHRSPPAESVMPMITPEMLNTLSIPTNLIPPQSYSYLETSFTRRLLRTALEAAQRLLRNPSTNPAQIHRLGRYAMCYMKRTRLLAWFEQVWSRPAHANLERWIAPIFHIGGSGLHYPREGIDVGAQRPENWADPGRIGPPTLMPIDRPEARSMSKTQVVDFADVGGEWYDSNDVEEYLKTKGVYLDATSTVVEIGEDEVPDMVQSNETSDSHSTGGSSSPANVEQIDPVRSTPFGPYWGMDSDFGTQVTDPRLQAYGFDFAFSDGPGMKSKKLVDVEAFMADLVNQSTCLGRTLGFRKESVDAALKMATTRVPVAI